MFWNKKENLDGQKKEMDNLNVKTAKSKKAVYQVKPSYDSYQECKISVHNTEKARKEADGSVAAAAAACENADIIYNISTSFIE